MISNGAVAHTRRLGGFTGRPWQVAPERWDPGRPEDGPGIAGRAVAGAGNAGVRGREAPGPRQMSEEAEGGVLGGEQGAVGFDQFAAYAGGAGVQ